MAAATPTRVRARISRRLLGMMLALVVAAGVGLIAFSVFSGPAKWGEVEPGMVYRCGRINGDDVRGRIKALGVQRILSLVSEDGKDPDVNSETEACRELGIERLNFRMAGDGIAPPEQYVAAVAALAEARKQGKPVLVHCSSGSQRTGAVVALYELLVMALPADQVYDHLGAYGHEPARNARLIPHLNDSMQAVVQGLVARGVIGAVPSPLPRLRIP